MRLPAAVAPALFFLGFASAACSPRAAQPTWVAPPSSPLAPEAALRPAQTPTATLPTHTATAPPTPTPTPSQRPPPALTLAAEAIHTGLDWPTAFAFAPDGRLFLTERLNGKVGVIQEGKMLPDPFLELSVVRGAETGLLGLALHPGFPDQPYLYVYYTYQEGRRPFNRVARFRISGERAGPMEVLLDRIPAANIHNGGAIAFGPDGRLYIPTGDATDQPAAQDPASLSGKVLRLNPDGSLPQDNPSPDSPVYTLGHRNIFGIAFHPQTRQPYITENGPTSDDEVNLLLPGANYGWPEALGKTGSQRYQDPILTFTPNIAPTGAAFYTGEALPQVYRGNLFFGDWNTGSLRRVVLKEEDPGSVERLETVLQLPGEGILAVVNGPDGHLYFSTPSAIYRVIARTAR